MNWLIGIFGTYCAAAAVFPKIRFGKLMKIPPIEGRNVVFDYLCAFLVCVGSLASSKHLMGEVFHGIFNIVILIFVIGYKRFW